MKTLLKYEVKKLFYHKIFVRIFLLFCMLAFILPITYLHFPDKDGKDGRELSKRYQIYINEFDINNSVVLAQKELEEQIQRLKWKEKVEQIALYPKDYQAIMWELLEEESGYKREALKDIMEQVVVPENSTIQNEILLLQEVYAYVQKIAEYPAFIENIFLQKEIILSSILGKEEVYAIRLAELTSKAYEPMQTVSIIASDPVGVSIAFGDDTDSVLLCGFSIFVCAFLFLQEKELHITALMLSAKNGRVGTYWGKIMVALGLSSLFCIVLLGSRLICGIYGIGLGDLSRPIQSVPDYYTCAWNFTVAEGLLFHGIIKIITTLLVTLLFCLVCVIFDGAIAWCGMLGSVAVSIMTYMGISETSVLQPLRYWNFCAFYNMKWFCEPTYLKIGTIPISYRLVLIISIAIITGLIILVGFEKGYKRKSIVFKNKKNFLKREISSEYTSNYENVGKEKYKYPFYRKKENRLKGIVYLEWKKILLPQYSFIIVIIVCFIQIIFANSFYARIGTAEKIYQNYLLELQGPYTKEKHEMVQKLYLEMSENAEYYQSVQLEAVEKLIELSDYLEAKSEITEVSYVYESGYEVLMGLREIGYRYQPLTIVISIILILSGVFSIEKESGMELLCNTTQGTKNMLRRKLKIAFWITFFLFVINWLPEVIFTIKNFPITEPFTSAISIQKLKNAPAWLSLAGVIVLVVCIRFLEMLAVAGMVLFYSYHSKTYLNTTVKSMLTLGIGIAVYYLWKIAIIYF